MRETYNLKSFYGIMTCTNNYKITATDKVFMCYELARVVSDNLSQVPSANTKTTVANVGSIKVHFINALCTILLVMICLFRNFPKQFFLFFMQYFTLRTFDK